MLIFIIYTFNFFIFIYLLFIYLFIHAQYKLYNIHMHL